MSLHTYSSDATTLQHRKLLDYKFAVLCTSQPHLFSTKTTPKERWVLLLKDRFAIFVEGPRVTLVVDGNLQLHELWLAPRVALH